MNKDRQNHLEPIRVKKAVKALNKLGYIPTVSENGKTVYFTFKGNKITYHAYSGWATGKGIEDGRGLKNLIDQLK